MYQNVGARAGYERPVVAQVVCERGVQRCQYERIDDRYPAPHAQPHEMVDVPLVEQVLRLAVVGAERAELDAVLEHER